MRPSPMIVLFLLFLPLSAAAETVFTFQGRLGNAGEPAEGSHDFVFRLFDGPSSGAQVGSDLARPGVDVIEGVFTAQLDFGVAPFESAPRWLEIDVRETGGEAYTTLGTRFRVGSAPFAIEALSIAPGSVDTIALQDDAVTRAKLADNSVGTFQIENNTVTSSDIRDGTVAVVDLAAGLYRSREDLYEVSEGPISVGLLPQNQTVTCNDSNDLPVFVRCGSETANQFLSTYLQSLNWTDESTPAGSTCTAVNVHPSDPSGNPVAVTVSIVCVEVPGT